MKNITGLLILALTLTGCGELKKQFGRQPGHTLVTFKVAREHNPTSVVYPLNGGILLIIKSSGTNAFATNAWLANESATAQISVPNGIYNAGAIGWEGSASPPCTPGTNCVAATGQSKCGIAYNDTPFSLTGGAVTIPITMTSTVCQQGYSGNSTPFADVAYNPTGDTAFPTIKFQLSGSYFTGTNYGGIWLNLYDMANGVKVRRSKILLGCTSYLGGAMATNHRLPVGKSGDSIFWFTLGLSASDTTCNTFTDSVEFENGLVANPTSRSNNIFPTTYTITYASNMNTITLN